MGLVTDKLTNVSLNRLANYSFVMKMSLRSGIGFIELIKLLQ
jgi:hypothetical protein